MAENIYESIHTGAEIDQLLGAVKNDNLLDNSNFTNPVNQRGAASYTNTARTTTIDRWIGTQNLSVTVNAGSILVKNTTEARNSLVQNFAPNKIPASGETLTLAIKTADGVVHCGSCKFPVNAGAYTIAFTLDDGTQARVYAADSSNPDRFVLYLPANGTIELEWAAVYRGKYTVKTLPAYKAKDYAVEQAECARYFERITAKTNNATIGIGVGTASDIYVPIKMSPKRATPAALSSAQLAGLRYGTNTLSTDAPKACTFFVSDNASGMYTLRVSGTFTAGTAYRLVLTAGNSIDFNAEI